MTNDIDQLVGVPRQYGQRDAVTRAPRSVLSNRGVNVNESVQRYWSPLTPREGTVTWNEWDLSHVVALRVYRSIATAYNVIGYEIHMIASDPSKRTDDVYELQFNTDTGDQLGAILTLFALKLPPAMQERLRSELLHHVAEAGKRAGEIQFQARIVEAAVTALSNFANSGGDAAPAITY